MLYFCRFTYICIHLAVLLSRSSTEPYVVCSSLFLTNHAAILNSPQVGYMYQPTLIHTSQSQSSIVIIQRVRNQLRSQGFEFLVIDPGTGCTAVSKFNFTGL